MDEIKKYKYYLCEFSGCVDENGKCDMDVIPISWMIYDKKKEELTVPYPDPPYTKTVCAKLHEMVEKNKKPNPAWKKWKIKIRGGADSYEKAEERLANMRADAYAFTTDQEDAESKAEDQTQIFQQESLEKILHVSDQDSSNQSSSQEETASSSSSDNARKPIKKKGKATKAKKIRFSVSNKGSSKRKLKDKTRKPSINLEQITPTPEVTTASTINPLIKPNSEPIIQDFEFANTDDMYQLDDEDLIARAEEIVGEIDSFTEKKFPVGYNYNANNTMLRNQPLNDPLPTFSKETTAILKTVLSVKLMVQNIQLDVTDLKNKIIGSDAAVLNQMLQERGLTFPLQTTVHWETFEQVLADDTFKEYVTLYFKSQVDKIGNNVTKSCTNILKRIFAKDLIAQFTAFRKVSSKHFVFNESGCYKILRDVILTSHRDGNGDFITEGIFRNALKAAFNNSKDWGGREKQHDIYKD